MNTERFQYCDLNEDGFLDIDEFEDYLFPHKSFKIVIASVKFISLDCQDSSTTNYHQQFMITISKLVILIGSPFFVAYKCNKGTMLQRTCCL